MSTPPAILFVNRFAPPDISATSQMLGSLAAALAAGHRVVIVTSRLHYDDPVARLPAQEKLGAVQVHRVWTSGFGRASRVGRVIDYLTFYLSASWRVWMLASRGDLVVAMTDPPIISVPLAIVANIRGARLVNWLQDVFPEVATRLGMRLGGGLITRVLTSLRNFSLRQAACNVVLGDRMQAVVQPLAPHVPTHVIHNWSPAESIVPLARADNPLASQWQIGNAFVVGYSGNLGRAHDVDTLIEAAQRLRDQPGILFLIIGAGGQKARLMEQAEQQRLANIRFEPYQPTAQLPYSLTVPDVHVISLKPALEGLIVPSKFYSSLAAGKPVLFIGAADGEIGSRLGGAAEMGLTVAPHDADALAAQILILQRDPTRCAAMGRHARAAYLAEFDPAVALQRWRDAIGAAANIR